MLPVLSALRSMATSRVGKAGACASMASDSGTPLRSSVRTASYTALALGSRPSSSPRMAKARTSGTPAASSVPRLRQKSATCAVFSGRTLLFPAPASR